MEDADIIIVQTLNQLGVSIPEDITTLDEFPENLILPSVKKCLNAILGEDEDLHIPAETSKKVIIAAKIASSCKDLGYKGDLGYQLFIYPNENDLRKIFTFLIEKLPKESEKSYMSTARDGLSLLMQNIGQKISEDLNELWFPPYSKAKSYNITSNGVWTDTGCAYIYPFNETPFSVEEHQDNVIEEFTNYWNRVIPDSQDEHCVDSGMLNSKEEADIIIEKLKQSKYKHPLKNISNVSTAHSWNSTKSHLFQEDQEAASLSLEDVKSAIIQIEETSKACNVQINQLITEKDKVLSERLIINQEYKKAEDKNDTNSLVINLLPDFENNIEKLKLIHVKETGKINKITNEIEAKTIRAKQREEQLKIKRQLVSSQSEKYKKIRAMKESLSKLSDEYNHKKSLRLRLEKECERRSSQKKYIRKRSAYTKRIMEIIGNISKQKIEINKILSDSNIVQKEINSINGKLERSFSVVDELVFKDAKKDDNARKTYKLLAYIHTECNAIISKVNETGTYLREIRDLERNVEAQKKKKITENLQRVYTDLKYEQAKKQESTNGT